MAGDTDGPRGILDRAEIILRFRSVFGLLDWQSAQIKEHMLAPFHLTGPQVTVLTILGTEAAQLDLSSIATKSGLPPGTATSVLDRLFLRRLAQRYESEVSGRRITWMITDEGRDVLEELDNRRTRLFEELVALYSDKELEQLLELFNRWTDLGDRVISARVDDLYQSQSSSVDRRGSADVLRELPHRR
jgi:DNA-binding MarR family transcriptional regulator